MASEEEKLAHLKQFEEEAKSKNSENISEEKISDNKIEENTPIEMDGYRVLTRIELPYKGELYPSNWQFAHKCPETNDVAEFSAIDERDQAKIMQEISKLIRKCYLIVDTETTKQIPTSQINDPEKLFFFLRLREHYLKDSPIVFQQFSRILEGPVEVTLKSHNLIYEGLNEKLLSCFDGRTWTIPTESFGLTEPIVFLHQTLDLSDKIYRYIKLQYEKVQDDDKKVDKNVLDKKFLTVLPFLYVTGNEKVESLRLKFNTIKNNEKLYEAYLSLVNRFNFTHQEFIEICPDGENTEKVLFKFPGGWKKMFLSTEKNFGGLFD